MVTMNTMFIRKKLNQEIIQLTKEGLGIRSTARVLKISASTLLKRIIKTFHSEHI